MSSSPTFLIVGAGLAAAKAAETLRAEGSGGRVLLFGDEGVLANERLPYFYSDQYDLGMEYSATPPPGNEWCSGATRPPAPSSASGSSISGSWPA